MAKIDGGPAFPTHGGHHPDDDPRNHTLGGGMSMRDWFAGQALVGMGAWGPAPHNWYGEAQLRAKAKYAYEIADAMLKARDATDADH